MPDTTPTMPPFRYVDEDAFHLSARLLPQLPATLSITIEGSDEPQSAHVPVGDLPQVLAGIATAAGVVLPVTDQQPVTAPAGTELRDRRDRYSAAIREESSRVDDVAIADAVMAIADSEIAAAHDALRRGNSRLADERARLRAEVERLRTDRAAEDRQTLAAALDGLHTLIATSSRDWQTYRVDAWVWAVLCGWDCEQAEHDATCTHGALEETAAMHGWDDATVAKARRYRAAVRRMANEAQQGSPEPEPGCAHCGGPHAWDDCETYTQLVADEAQQPETEAAYVPETDHPGAELFVLLRKAGLGPDTARALIRSHAAMAARMTTALHDEAQQPDTGLPAEQPCTDPRHTGEIRKQLGCNGPDPATQAPTDQQPR